MPRKRKTPVADPDSPDFKNAQELMAVHADASNRLVHLEAEVADQVIAIKDHITSEYAKLADAKAKAEAALEAIAKRNPQWFEAVKTLKLLHGSIKSTSSKSIDVPSLESTIRLIKADGRKAANQFIRTEETLDKEALESLSDDELARYGLRRERKESLKFTPAKTDLGKVEPQRKAS